jgi:hypothetical protein
MRNKLRLAGVKNIFTKKNTRPIKTTKNVFMPPIMPLKQKTLT